MIPEKLKILIRLLIDKTLVKKAIWEKGSGGGNPFKLSISGGIAIIITEWENMYNHEDGYEVIIFNSNGDPIEKFSTDGSSSMEEIGTLQLFHKVASDQYYKVEETLDALLKSVESADIIGKREESTDEGDDLPF